MSSIFVLGVIREVLGFLVFILVLYPFLSGRDTIDPEDEDIEEAMYESQIEEVPSQASPQDLGNVPENERTLLQQDIHP